MLQEATMGSMIEAVVPASADTDDLHFFHDKLDTLWQRYLDHLDRYQKAQNELQKDLSAVSTSMYLIALC